MVIKVGIDQIPRRLWKFESEGYGWINANFVNKGPPKDRVEAFHKDGEYVYGFNDFVIAELTPHMAYQVRGAGGSNATLAPPHPRGDPRISTWNPVFKSRSGYFNIAYGWGQKSDIFDLESKKNEYVVLDGPKDESWTGDPIVKLIALPIPGGLKQNDTFWIDLNKGLRALYFPARYIYSKDFPGDAAYAKISFVEEKSRPLIDATSLIIENTVGKLIKPWFGDTVPALSTLTRSNTDLANLNIEPTVGAYSFDSTLIVNVPQFIESSFLVSMDLSSPHDSIYLAKSTDIKAHPRTDGIDLTNILGKKPQMLERQMDSKTVSKVMDFISKHPEGGTFKLNTDSLNDSGNGFKFPGRALWIEWNTVTYAQYISTIDQINLKQVTKSDLSPGAEIALSVFTMAASLVPYIGPILATGGTFLIENLKNVKTSDDVAELNAFGVSAAAWNMAPNEVKDAAIARASKEIVRVAKMFRR